MASAVIITDNKNELQFKKSSTTSSSASGNRKRHYLMDNHNQQEQRPDFQKMAIETRSKINLCWHLPTMPSFKSSLSSSSSSSSSPSIVSSTAAPSPISSLSLSTITTEASLKCAPTAATSLTLTTLSSVSSSPSSSSLIPLSSFSLWPDSRSTNQQATSTFASILTTLSNNNNNNINNSKHKNNNTSLSSLLSSRCSWSWFQSSTSCPASTFKSSLSTSKLMQIMVIICVLYNLAIINVQCQSVISLSSSSTAAAATAASSQSPSSTFTNNNNNPNIGNDLHFHNNNNNNNELLASTSVVSSTTSTSTISSDNNNIGNNDNDNQFGQPSLSPLSSSSVSVTASAAAAARPSIIINSPSVNNNNADNVNNVTALEINLEDPMVREESIERKSVIDDESAKNSLTTDVDNNNTNNENNSNNVNDNGNNNNNGNDNNKPVVMFAIATDLPKNTSHSWSTSSSTVFASPESSSSIMIPQQSIVSHVHSKRPHSYRSSSAAAPILPQYYPAQQSSSSASASSSLQQQPRSMPAKIPFKLGRKLFRKKVTTSITVNKPNIVNKIQALLPKNENANVDSKHFWLSKFPNHHYQQSTAGQEKNSTSNNEIWKNGSSSLIRRRSDDQKIESGSPSYGYYSNSYPPARSWWWARYLTNAAMAAANQSPQLQDQNQPRQFQGPQSESADTSGSNIIPQYATISFVPQSGQGQTPAGAESGMQPQTITLAELVKTLTQPDNPYEIQVNQIELIPNGEPEQMPSQGPQEMYQGRKMYPMPPVHPVNTYASYSNTNAPYQGYAPTQPQGNLNQAPIRYGNRLFHRSISTASASQMNNNIITGVGRKLYPSSSRLISSPYSYYANRQQQHYTSQNNNNNHHHRQHQHANHSPPPQDRPRNTNEFFLQNPSTSIQYQASAPAPASGQQQQLSSSPSSSSSSSSSLSSSSSSSTVTQPQTHESSSSSTSISIIAGRNVSTAVPANDLPIDESASSTIALTSSSAAGSLSSSPVSSGSTSSSSSDGHIAYHSQPIYHQARSLSSSLPAQPPSSPAKYYSSHRSLSSAASSVSSPTIITSSSTNNIFKQNFLLRNVNNNDNYNQPGNDLSISNSNVPPFVVQNSNAIRTSMSGKQAQSSSSSLLSSSSNESPSSSSSSPIIKFSVKDGVNENAFGTPFSSSSSSSSTGSMFLSKNGARLSSDNRVFGASTSIQSSLFEDETNDQTEPRRIKMGSFLKPRSLWRSGDPSRVILEKYDLSDIFCKTKFKPMINPPSTILDISRNGRQLKRSSSRNDESNVASESKTIKFINSEWTPLAPPKFRLTRRLGIQLNKNVTNNLASVNQTRIETKNDTTTKILSRSKRQTGIDLQNVVELQSIIGNLPEGTLIKQVDPSTTELLLRLLRKTSANEELQKKRITKVYYVDLGPNGQNPFALKDKLENTSGTSTAGDLSRINTGTNLAPYQQGFGTFNNNRPSGTFTGGVAPSLNFRQPTPTSTPAPATAPVTSTTTTPRPGLVSNFNTLVNNNGPRFILNENDYEYGELLCEGRFTGSMPDLRNDCRLYFECNPDTIDTYACPENQRFDLSRQQCVPEKEAYCPRYTT